MNLWVVDHTNKRWPCSQALIFVRPLQGQHKCRRMQSTFAGRNRYLGGFHNIVGGVCSMPQQTEKKMCLLLPLSDSVSHVLLHFCIHIIASFCVDLYLSHKIGPCTRIFFQKLGACSWGPLDPYMTAFPQREQLIAEYRGVWIVVVLKKTKAIVFMRMLEQATGRNVTSVQQIWFVLWGAISNQIFVWPRCAWNNGCVVRGGNPFHRRIPLPFRTHTRLTHTHNRCCRQTMGHLWSGRQNNHDVGIPSICFLTKKKSFISGGTWNGRTKVLWGIPCTQHLNTHTGNLFFFPQVWHP